MWTNDGLEGRYYVGKNIVLSISLILPTTTTWSLESWQDNISISMRKTESIIWKVKQVSIVCFRKCICFMLSKKKKKEEKKEIQTGSLYEQYLN